MSFRLIFFSTLFFVLSLIAFNTFGQQNGLVNGVVFEKGTKLRVALAEVKNKRSGFAVGTNDIGVFTIKANLGDTLMIAKRNFEPLEVVIKSQKDLILFLDKGNVLNEVLITGQTKAKALEEVRNDYKAKGSFYAGKPPVLSFLFSPLTALYELFGKTPKQARRFERMYQNEMQDSYVDRFFNKSLIKQHTGLTGKDLENFMINYRPDYENAKNWNSYDGLKWIAESYKRYADTAKIVK